MASNDPPPPAPQFSDFFSTKKPKDFKGGLASGGKSLLKGIAGGAAGLVAAPALGAATEGASGFAKGLAAGLAGAVALPLAGAGVAVAQVVRGVAAAPEAIRAEAAGFTWDRATRTWIDPNNLPVARRPEGAPSSSSTSSFPRSSSAAAGAGASSSPSPSSANDSDLYSVLGVPRSATPEEIRKAYFAIAKRLHPDKNPGDAAAAAKFASCARAYGVLGDPASRQRYDALGAAAIDAISGGGSALDPAVFFGVLFGSERFAHLVGELALCSAVKGGGATAAAAAAAASSSNDGNPSSSLSDALSAELERQRRAQEEREEALTVNLLALLKRWEVGDEEGFAAAAAAEGAELASASFGPPLLSTIAGCYAAAAERELAGPLAGRLAAAAASASRFGAKARAAGAAVKAAAAQLALEEAARKEAAAVAAAREAREAKEARRERAHDGPEGTAAAGAAGEEASATVTTTTTTTTAATAEARQREEVGEEREGGGEEQDPTAAATAASTARAKAEAAALPAMLDAAWRATRCDIQSTLAGVCRRVLRGGGGSGTNAVVEESVRLRRAAGLRALAGAFSAASASAVAAAGGQDPAKAARTSAEAARAAVEAVAVALATAAAEEDDE